ncbi:ABC transporter permease [Janibacter massiliensis]|uniref:ABC transporter permease n=1 Tax=Janibacter massiliensis TaxID=2058291 RepID=UPI000D103FA3|nr:iron ABC transporter permease [Janibacter massiliensis]
MSASSDLRATAGRATVSTAALAVAAISLAPLLVVASRAFGAPWHEVTAYFLRPRMGELVGHTLALVGVTVPATVVLGIGCAWLVERTDVPAPSLWRILLTAPLAVPAFVSSYAWTSAVPGMEGLGGAALVTTLAYLPFVLLPVAAVLRDLDLADEEVARSLGLGPRAAVLRTVLPRLRPAASGGALLVALHLLAEFGVLEMMRYPTVTTAILTQYSMGFSNDEGAMLAMVLVVMCLALLGLEMLLRGRARTARLGRGVHQRAGRSALGPWRWPATALLAVVVLLAVAVPLGQVGRWLVRWVDRGAPGAAELLAAAGSTLLLAAAAAVVAILAALPGAWRLDRHRNVGTIAMERVTYLASALPGVVVGLAMVTIAVRWLPALYQSAGMLVVAYSVLFVPRAMVTLRSGLAAAPPELSEAARALGSDGFDTFRRVVAPLVLPSALTGAALVFIAASTELTATLLLAPTGTETLATGFWEATSEIDYVAAAPYAALMIVLSAPVTLLMLRQSGASR